MTTNIYILKLEKQKFYVGKTENVSRRYQEHVNGTGSTWTKKYKPVSLEKVISNASPFDEDKYVKEYMSKYGIDNVRGGAYVTEMLTGAQRDILSKEIRAATDCCTKCGSKTHWLKDCGKPLYTKHSEKKWDPYGDSSESEEEYGSEKSYD